MSHVPEGAGEPLSPRLRSRFETGFGADLSGVRIHRGAVAEASARRLSARAYTIGPHISFGAGAWSPESARGQRLIAHELAHVVQQRDARPAEQPLVGRVDDLHEREARTAAGAVMAHGTTRHPVRSSIVEQRIQRDEGDAEVEEEEGTSLADRVIRRAIDQAAIEAAHAMRGALPIAIPETILAALVAAEMGFLLRSYQRLVDQGDGLRILGRIREFAHPTTAGAFVLRYIWGVLKGLISPITGLVQLAIGAVRLMAVGAQWLDTLPTRAPALVAEAQALGAAMEAFGAQASTTLASLRDRAHLLEFAAAVFEAARSGSSGLEQRLVHGAQARGRQAADSLITHFLDTPLAELGELAGEIVGTVVIELVLLLFTDGIGNLISRLGEFARALRPLSRGVVAFAEVAGRIGRVITQVEHLVGILLSRTVLRPFMPLFEALQPLLGRMRQFAQRLVGVGEESTLALARAGAAGVDESAAIAGRTTERAGARPPSAAATSPRLAPPVEPPPPVVAPELPRRPPPVRGATASGEGEAFRYRYHPEAPTPVVTRRPARVRPSAPELPPTRRAPTRRPVPAAADDLAEDLERSDLGDVIHEETGGTASRGDEPLERGSAGDPSELAVPIENEAAGELAGLPSPQRVRPIIGSAESIEAARLAGVPDEVLHSGTVLTGRDLPDVVPDLPLPRGRAAPDLPPVAEELERGVAGRRPTTAPDPSDVQHTELLGDIDLTRRQIEAAGGRVEEVAINRRQRVGPGGAAESASRRTRPDVQLAVVDADLNGRRILIEYDRAPGTRALAHARAILARDPRAIVIIKIIGFE